MKSNLIKACLSTLIFSVSLASWAQDKSPVSITPQKGLDINKAAEEYRDWQARFKDDAEKFIAEVKRSKRALNQEAVKAHFARSLSPGFPMMFFGEETQTRDLAGRSPIFMGPVTLLIRALTDLHASPVGYGGMQKLRSGEAAEVWYVSLPFDKEDFQALPSYQLPPYGKLERDVFPIVFFQRGKDDKLLAANFSIELLKITNEAFERRLQ